MTYKQKTIAASLFSHVLIGGYYVWRILQMRQDGSFINENVFRLWWIIILATIFVTIASTIATAIISGVITQIRTGEKVSFVEDERDRMFDLRGSQFTNLGYSLGVVGSMLLFVFGQPALVMFSALILAGIIGEIIGNSVKLYLYRRGY